MSERKYTGYALEQAKHRYEKVCQEIDSFETMSVNQKEELVTTTYDEDVIRRVMDHLPKAMAFSREAGQQLIRDIIKELVIFNKGPRKRQCPLCKKQFQCLAVTHTRQHGCEKEDFLRKFPAVGFSHRAKIAMTFTPVGILSNETIVTLEIPEMLPLTWFIRFSSWRNFAIFVSD